MYQIAVIGSNKIKDKVTMDIAYEIGAEIAKKKYILLCGGKDGVMKHAARGAKEHGGITIGILPENDFSSANEYIDIKIATGMGYARNILLIRSADVVVAVEGSTGTLSEMAHASNEKKPLIIVKGSGGICDFLVNTTCEYLSFHVVENPKDAIQMVDELLRK